MRNLLMVLLSLFLMASCGEEKDKGGRDSGAADGGALDDGGEGDGGAGDVEALPDLPPEPRIRFVHITDPHLFADDSAPNNEMLRQVVAEVNALDPLPHLVVVTGDLAHYADPADVEAGQGPHVHFKAIMDELEVPWYAVAGNHDYYIDPELTLVPDRDERNAYLEEILGTPTWYSFDFQGIRFILLNSMQGPLWDAHVGSLGNEQLEWFREELSQGGPALLFVHHPPDNILIEEGEDSLGSALEDHPGVVEAIFAGHFHWFSEGEFQGIPLWVGGTSQDDPLYWYHVEYDRESHQITILNHESLPFGALRGYNCEEGIDELEDPMAFVGTVQRLVVTNGVSDGEGLASYLADGVAYVPLVLSFDSYDPAAGTYRARITMGLPEEGTYVQYMDGGPCEEITFDLLDPCMEGQPIDILYDASSLGYLISDDPLSSEWILNVLINDLTIRAKGVSQMGGNVLMDGTFHATFDVNQTIEDIHTIMVEEYCAGNMDPCMPGASEEMPECPDEAGAEFFSEIPLECDITVGDFSARLVLLMVNPLLGQIISLDANLDTVIIEASEGEAENSYDPKLFSTEEGMNCHGL